MTAEPEENDQTNREPGGLMFAWRQRRQTFAYLGIFVGAALVIHLLGFYLFQVVYPATGRLEPEPSRVTLLNESQPAVSALLREIEDRLVYLRPASSGSDVRVSMRSHTAQFQPSFSERQVNFKAIPPIAAVRGSDPGSVADPLAPRGTDRPSGLILPPVPADSSGASPPGSANEAEPRWRVSGELEGRALRDADAFAEALPDLEVPPAIRFRIGIGSNGAVLSHLPVAGQDHPRIGDISEAVRKALHFEPESETELEWGWLEIRR